MMLGCSCRKRVFSSIIVITTTTWWCVIQTIRPVGVRKTFKQKFSGPYGGESHLVVSGLDLWAPSAPNQELLNHHHHDKVWYDDNHPNKKKWEKKFSK